MSCDDKYIPSPNSPLIFFLLSEMSSKDEKLQEEREYICHESSSGSQQRSSYDTSLERTKRRNCEKYGKMPRLQTNVPNQTQRVPEFPPVYTNNIFAIEGSDPNEWQYWDAFVNYNPMDDISFQNSTSPSATLPNEHGSKFLLLSHFPY